MSQSLSQIEVVHVRGVADVPFDLSFDAEVWQAAGQDERRRLVNDALAGAIYSKDEDVELYDIAACDNWDED